MSVMSSYQATSGIQLAYDDAVGIVFANGINNLRSIDELPGGAVDEFDVTSLDQTDLGKDMEPDKFEDPGNLAFTVGQDDTEIGALEALKDSRSKRNWKIAWASGAKKVGLGWLKDIKPTANAKGETVWKVTVRCASKWVFTAAV